MCVTEKSFFITFWNYIVEIYLPSNNPRLHMTKHSGRPATISNPELRCSGEIHYIMYIPFHKSTCVLDHPFNKYLLREKYHILSYNHYYVDTITIQLSFIFMARNQLAEPSTTLWCTLEIFIGVN